MSIIQVFINSKTYILLMTLAIRAQRIFANIDIKNKKNKLITYILYIFKISIGYLICF